MSRKEKQLAVLQCIDWWPFSNVGHFETFLGSWSPQIFYSHSSVSPLLLTETHCRFIYVAFIKLNFVPKLELYTKHSARWCFFACFCFSSNVVSILPKWGNSTEFSHFGLLCDKCLDGVFPVTVNLLVVLFLPARHHSLHIPYILCPPFNLSAAPFSRTPSLFLWLTILLRTRFLSPAVIFGFTALPAALCLTYSASGSGNDGAVVLQGLPSIVDAPLCERALVFT